MKLGSKITIDGERYEVVSVYRNGGAKVRAPSGVKTVTAAKIAEHRLGIAARAREKINGNFYAVLNAKTGERVYVGRSIDKSAEALEPGTVFGVGIYAADAVAQAEMQRCQPTR